MHPVFTYLPVPLFPSMPMKSPPPRKEIQKTPPDKWKNLVMEFVVWPFESGIVHFDHSFLLISVHCYDTWSGSRPQTSGKLSIMDSLGLLLTLLLVYVMDIL